jgi:hypothetical protein
MALAFTITRSRPGGLFMIACLASDALGALVASSARSLPLQADDGAAVGHAAPAGVKAPIAEVLHCPLAFAGVHLLNEIPERSAVACHYC